MSPMIGERSEKKITIILCITDKLVKIFFLKSRLLYRVAYTNIVNMAL